MRRSRRRSAHERLLRVGERYGERDLDLDDALWRAIELDDSRDDREARRFPDDDHVDQLLVRDDPPTLRQR
jgi:hypothetical protein